MNPIMMEFKAQFPPLYYKGIPDRVIEKTFMYQHWLFRRQSKVLARTMSKLILAQIVNPKFSIPSRQLIEAECRAMQYYRVPKENIPGLRKMAAHMAKRTPESISWWIYKFSQMYQDGRLHFKD